ncbi:cytochrome b [Rhodovulum sp. DZ06]|uniref:cytochrome b n=1 Tax=Rhodovulum sp. DZ06 TaxID=3425126 RepID=UPI003D33B187
MTAATYSKPQKLLHWAAAVLILLQFTLLEEIGRGFRTLMQTGMAEYSPVVIGHIAAGSLVLLFALWRLVLRRTHGAPLPPAEEPELFRKAAHWGHIALYALMIGLPLGGLLAWFGGVGFAGEIHEIGANLLLAVLAAHVGAVLVHQFVWKTGLLKRMSLR